MSGYSLIEWIYSHLKMTRSDIEHLAKQIVQKYKTLADQKISITVNHFIVENIPCPTIYSIIRKYDTSSTVHDKLGS